MAVVDRSFSDVLQDIVRNIQEIIRSEVRLAKTEVREEINRARSSVVLLGLGLLSVIFGMLFILIAIFNALARVVPDWAAALIVALGLGICAAMALTQGMKRLKTLDGAPKTMASLKENVEWAKRQIK